MVGVKERWFRRAPAWLIGGFLGGVAVLMLAARLLYFTE
jgi:hypothetical protein